MHFSYLTYSIGALALGHLSSAHPTNRTTTAATTNTTADIPRVTLKNTFDHTNQPISLPSTVLVHTNTTTYSQHAYTLPSASTCNDLCQADTQKDCIMATYKNRTELCLLHINMQEVETTWKTAQCPLGLPYSGYEKAEDPAGDGVGFEDADGYGQEAVWMEGPCLDPGDGSVGDTFK